MGGGDLYGRADDVGGELLGGQDPGALGPPFPPPEDMEVPCRACQDGDHARCWYTAGRRDLIGDGYIARCCCDLERGR